MAVNLGQLSNVTTSANALSKLVLVTPSPNNVYTPGNPSTGGLGFLNNLLKENPPGILFHYEGENNVSLESDITDHYIEDNTAIQDQIALRPEIISVHGYIGELNDVPPKLLGIAGLINDKLAVLGPYAPKITKTAQQALNVATQAYATANTALTAGVSAWASISGKSSPQNNQQAAFQQFYGYWKKRTLFSVQTPWATFQNCAIFKLRAIQSEETRVITDFELTFKLIRTASTQNSIFSLAAGRLQSQAASLVTNGTSTPSASGAPSITSALGGVR